MRKLLILSIVLLMGLTMYNCKDDVTPSYNLTVALDLPDGFDLATVPSGIEVTFVNTQTGRESILTTGESGSVTGLLVEGNYNITCSFAVTVDEEEYTFNGNLNNYYLSAESAMSMDLVLAANTGGFVLKEVYFSGSRTPEDKPYYHDQFHEIYNNSTDTLYADGLCIGVLQQTSTKPNIWVNEDETFMDKLPIAYHSWRIPGDGDDHPVYPGESIIIAQDGIDHKADENGNPNSPVNLGDADWEAYVEISGKDLDSPNVPNMTMMYTTSTSMMDWLHSVFGAAVIIYKLPDNWESYVNDVNNYMTKPGSTSSTKYFMVDKSFVIDAIEIVRVEEEKRYKRLHDELDAGYTYLEGGTYCSKSIRRKAKLIVDGRVIYKDTNNSSEDLLHDLEPTPGVHPTSVED